ncbi:MAG: hypothetical protein MZV65_29255 [Chromatiales bacterium]|nr:hypothetical protein [Chromatiales bacterium]
MKEVANEQRQRSRIRTGGLKADYDSVLVEPWSPYLGAILLVLVIFGADAERPSSGACSAASSCGATGSTT